MAQQTDTDEQPPTFPQMLEQLEKIFNLQFNTAITEFLEHNELEEILPDDVGELDEWIEDIVSKFVENESPTVDEIVKGSAAVFMMGMLERILEAAGIGAPSDDGDGDGDPADDGPTDDGGGDD